jgi:hypothetical protein
MKIAWRNIARHKVYATVNVLGLTVGVCACLAIFLITRSEFSFDTFHDGKERIYRIMGDVTESTGDKLHFARVPYPVSLNGRNEISGIETITGVIPYDAKISIPQPANEPIKYFENSLPGTHFITTAIVEPQYFEIFSYKWLAGNPNTALLSGFTVVLTESKARQYFGNIPVTEMTGKQVIYQDSLIRKRILTWHLQILFLQAHYKAVF